MSEPILKISDLKVNYGGIEAVKGISFEVPQGEIVTLIGANGAGKSSTLRSIAGLVKPRSGEIGFQGESITGKSPNYIVSKGITLVPEGRRIFPDLSVVENLRIGAYLRSDDLSDDLNWVYDLFPRLKERSWQAGGTLSGGEQQMLAVGRALMSRPKVIMTVIGITGGTGSGKTTALNALEKQGALIIDCDAVYHGNDGRDRKFHHQPPDRLGFKKHQSVLALFFIHFLYLLALQTAMLPQIKIFVNRKSPYSLRTRAFPAE